MFHPSLYFCLGFSPPLFFSSQSLSPPNSTARSPQLCLPLDLDKHVKTYHYATPAVAKSTPSVPFLSSMINTCKQGQSSGYHYVFLQLLCVNFIKTSCILLNMEDVKQTAPKVIVWVCMCVIWLFEK